MVYALSPKVDALEPVIPQIGYPPDRVVTELTGGLVRIHRRVEIYEADGTTAYNIPHWDGRLSDGAVTVDRDRDERRMCDFMLDNTDRALKNDPHDGFWHDKILKCFWGIRYYDTTISKWRRWETQLGEFMIDRLDYDSFPNLVKVVGRDYTKKCITSRLSSSMSFPQGVTIDQMILALAANAGVKKFALPPTGQAYVADTVFMRGTERWEVIKKLADMIGYEVYFRGDGYLTMRPYPDPTLDPIAWSFTEDEDGTLVKYSKSSNDSRIFNHVIVTGAALGGEPSSLGGAVTGNTTSQVVFAEAKNTNPGSPTRISRIGDRVLPYESEYFSTVEMAQNYANTMLRIAALEEYSMAFEAVILPFLDASDIVEIRHDQEEDIYTPNRFLLSNFTIPMQLGPMSGTARRVTVVGTRQNQEFI